MDQPYNQNEGQSITRATGVLVIEVRNCNPNGDPDRESDPRQRLHDQRGMITGVSFKRKLRDLVEEKEGVVWRHVKTTMSLDDDEYCILESRNRGYADVQEAADAWSKVVQLINEHGDGTGINNRYWDARLFGATFLEKGEDASAEGAPGGDGKHIRSGVAQFGLGVSVAPVRIQRETTTKKASAQKSKDRGMAPLAMRFVEHGVYTMPFFVNPSSAHKSGCRRNDVELMLRLIKAAYGHTPSNSRQMVEVRHAWYGEHTDPLCSYSEFEFMHALTPKRKPVDGKITPSSDQLTLEEQYDVPSELPPTLKGCVNNFVDLTKNLPDWFANNERTD